MKSSKKSMSKKPKMQMGGIPVGTPVAVRAAAPAAVPAKKGRSGPGITGVKRAVFNRAANDWGEQPNTQWSQDQMENWKKDVIKNPNYKKGGSVGKSKKPKMQMGGSSTSNSNWRSKVTPLPKSTRPPAPAGSGEKLYNTLKKMGITPIVGPGYKPKAKMGGTIKKMSKKK